MIGDVMCHSVVGLRRGGGGGSKGEGMDELVLNATRMIWPESTDGRGAHWT